ncbi:MAG TPA: IS110 family transposase [Phycisphaerales bacterium]|nr:IS110 family transposase [Phycisphaerales bacterium]
MRYVGLDVHWRTSTLCILDENGGKVKTQTVRGSWEKLLAELAKVPRPWSVCFEASCGYGVLHDRLRKLAARVVVAHPGRLRLIFRSKRKNDRLDAEKLAKLLYLDEVPAAHVPSPAVREWRALIEFRRALVDKRVRVKNALRSLLRSLGLAMPRGLWTKKGLAWLAATDLPSGSAAVRRDLLLDELESLRRKVKRVTSELDAIGASKASVAVLRTIPGVGPRTAEAVAAYVDDPHRFVRLRRVGSYFGLVPCQDASAGLNRLGRITREGPATPRKYLIEAAWRVVQLNAVARARFDRIAGGQRERRKIALVATAHWLLRCMLSMLQTGEAWRWAA